MDKDYFNVLVFGQKTSKTRHLRIHKKTFKIGLYLLAFGLLSTIFFFCDYIQVRKETFELNKLRQETQEQRSKIHFFSSKIEDLESQLSKLKDFDKKIRIIANLEKGQEATSYMGMGGPSPSDVREKLKAEKDEKGLVQQMRTDIERLKSEAASREESLSELEKLLQTKKEVLVSTPSIWPVQGWVTSGFGFRTNPFTGLTQMHEGIDISNRTGTLITAPADGIISDIRVTIPIKWIIWVGYNRIWAGPADKIWIKPASIIEQQPKLDRVAVLPGESVSGRQRPGSETLRPPRLVALLPALHSIGIQGNGGAAQVIIRMA